MSEGRALLDEIEKLRKIQAELTTISHRTDAERKTEMVQLRRLLSLQMGAISAEADKGYLKTADQENTKSFRSLLSNMRRATALHQANFPAVSLDNQNAEFQESIKSVRAANNEFFEWVNANIRH